MRALFFSLLLLPALALASEKRAAPEDPLEILWSHRLHFAPDGSPLISVRIDEGEERIELVPKGPALLHLGKKRIPLAPDEPITFRVLGGKAAEQAFAAQVAEVPFRDKEAAQAAISAWRARGFSARTAILGGVAGVRGRILDNRRYAILLGAPGPRAKAEALIEELRSRFPEESPQLYAALTRRPGGLVEVRNRRGVVLGKVKGVATVEPRGAAGILVKSVEHDVGYANHGREDRVYAGSVFLTVGADGRAAAVNVLPMEELLRGIVPSELYATAPLEALEAQAVTARGEVLAKIGARHGADPYAICAEQHCQVYKGVSGAHPRTDEAIASSRGEVLFTQDGRLVDSVFSSTCGGHTENNESVWGTPPDPSLRGVPDWIGDRPELAPFVAQVGDVEKWLASDVPGMCRLASFARPDKYRWERRFTASELDAIGAQLGVGRVLSLGVTGRGASGRATGLAITGEKGATVIRGELKIRRLLGNLNSSLFVIEREGPASRPTGWRFRGAGWGHGVGMCQTGAIGRAEQGQDHRAILRHYFNGAEVVPLY